MAGVGRLLWKQNSKLSQPWQSEAQKASFVRPLVFEKQHETDSSSLGRETITQLCRLASAHESSKTHGTIILPPFGYDGLLGLINRAVEREKGEMLAHFLAGSGALRLYIGENKIFSPNAYYAAIAMLKKEKRARMRFPAIVEEMLSRAHEMSEYLGRRFMQKKHADGDGKGTRAIDISDDEYVSLFLREFLPPFDKKCMICDEDGQNSRHHILPKGAFRELHERNKEGICKQLSGKMYSVHNGKGLLREAGDFGRNLMSLCKKCHRALESEINRTTLVQTPNDEYGHLIVADLFIIPAKKIAQYGLAELSYGDPQMLSIARKIEDNIALECFNFYKTMEKS